MRIMGAYARRNMEDIDAIRRHTNQLEDGTVGIAYQMILLGLALPEQFDGEAFQQYYDQGYNARGGKSPNIVFADADIDEAINWVNFGIYFNHGQCCCAGSRIYVQEEIYDKFLERFRERAAQNAVGDPFKEDTFQGPQVSQLQFDRIMGYIEEGKKSGATIETGGNRKGDKGYFIEPTIFSNVTEDMKIQQEEIFGPVCTISKFKTKADVIKIGNNTTYGLAAAVHTTNLTTAIEVANALRAGTVWVNTYNTLHWQLPFGGYKESGVGRELGEAALDNYLQTKTVSIRLGDVLFG